MADRLAELAGAEFKYRHTTTYTEGGETFAEGVVEASADGQSAEFAVVIGVVETDGRWWAVRQVCSTDDCLDIVRE